MRNLISVLALALLLPLVGACDPPAATQDGETPDESPLADVPPASSPLAPPSGEPGRGAPARQEPSSEEAIRTALMSGVPAGRWREGQLFEGLQPMPWLRSASNWFPRTEEVQPNEIRVIFMGTSPVIRPGQMNTSIFIQLGNGENFVFDIGEGSIANYSAAGFALNQLDKIFITHLHVDHFGSLPYLYVFGGWTGRWHQPLEVYGPSGRTPEHGTDAMITGMKGMVGWHTDSFDLFPNGQGWDIEVNEFDFRDNGGVIYDRDGVRIIHWQRSHGKDGASAYRLDWNGMCVTWTGDGRPSQLDVDYARGCDLFITEMQPELVEVSSGVAGVPPFLTRFTIDTHHTPGYAAGYLANEVGPRLFMTTHMPFDAYANEEQTAEVRHHWKGPYHFGAPDGIVVNMTQDAMWVREGVLPDYPNNRAPQQDFSNGQLIVPHPRNRREDIQEPFIREQEIDPDLYYPEGFHPELLLDWPVEGDLVVPYDALPDSLRDSMGGAWQQRQRNRQALRDQSAAEAGDDQADDAAE